MKPFLDFDAEFLPNGFEINHLRCAELPKGFYCRIYPNTDSAGGFHRKTKANGNGSIRYDWHRTREEAMDAARKWCYRKVQEFRREVKRHEELMNISVGNEF